MLNKRDIIKSNMKLMIMGLLVAAAIGCFTIASYASSLTDLNNKINNAQSEINEKNKKAGNLSTEMSDVNARISETKNEISSLSKEVSEAHDKVVAANQKLEDEKKKLDEENENLGARLRNIYKSGGVAFVDVILSSNSPSELFSNFEMVKYIFKNDNEMVTALKKSYEEIKDEKEALAKLEENLKSKQAQLSEKEQSLNADYALLADKKSSVEGDVAALEKQIAQWKAEEASIRATIDNNSSGSGGSYSGGSSATGFIRPASGVLTSGYGWREHWVGGVFYSRLHAGIDIASSTGTPIYASKAGRVIKAGWSDTYGYVVIIDHGGGFTTLYAHNSSLSVSVGQIVDQGQRIASMGSTGLSTGPHCHFEIRINGNPVDPAQYV